MNLDELRPILHAYRAQVEQAWSPATAHEGYEGKAGDPAGQCGVTSAWLQRRLLEDHGIEALYCVGTVFCPWHDRTPAHCWLEIGRSWDAIVIDLTADQIPCLKATPLMYAKVRTLRKERISYLWERRLTSDDLLADPVQERLDVLQEALS